MLQARGRVRSACSLTLVILKQELGQRGLETVLEKQYERASDKRTCGPGSPVSSTLPMNMRYLEQ